MFVLSYFVFLLGPIPQLGGPSGFRLQFLDLRRWRRFLPPSLPGEREARHHGGHGGQGHRRDEVPGGRVAGHVHTGEMQGKRDQ